MSGIPAMFFDRDGVIIENAHYLARLSDIRPIRGAAAAIRRLNMSGIPVVVITNQSGVARGYFPESFVRETHSYLNELFAREDARVDAWYYCPHHPEHGLDCDCRKPKPGMLLSAAREMNLDLSRSWLIGDNLTDCEAGAAAGCRTILVRTGHGAKMAIPVDSTDLNLQAVVDGLPDAVDFYFDRQEQRRAA
jgi:D-glycero-D-manno-heptose 1,7-bisphosphate phosphatase